MSKKERPVNFERPRDEDGHFLPKELWTKNEIREHERLKEEGVFKNPMRKVKISGKKRAKDLYILPQGSKGKFVPKSQWTEAERKLAKKAQKEGKTIAAQLPRDAKGRFISPTGKKPKKKKGQIVPSVEYPMMPAVTTGDGRGLHQGNVTVVYPPYPPHPAPLPPLAPAPLPPPAPEVRLIPLPIHPRLLQQLQAHDLERLPVRVSQEDEAPEVFASGGRLYERDSETGQITDCGSIAQLQETLKDYIKEAHGETRLTAKQLLQAIEDLGKMYPPWYAEVLAKPTKVTQEESPEELVEESPEELSEHTSVYTAEELRKITEQDPSPWEKKILVPNPRSRYSMYYVKRTFSDRVGDALGNLARSPLLVFVAVGAIFAIGYGLYRAFKAFRYRMLNSVGVEIVGGTIYFPGEQPYIITEDDQLWLARSIWGEVNRDPAAWTRSDVQQGGAAVLWAFANHYITVGNKRNLYPTLGEFVQAYSQPINPRWDDASDSRCQANPSMCTPDKLAFRNALRAKPWAEFPPALQNLVIGFTSGQVHNPVGTRTDFRAAGTGYVPADPINIAGNIFGTADNARRRPVEQVA